MLAAVEMQRTESTFEQIPIMCVRSIGVSEPERFKFSLLMCDSDLTPAHSSSPEARRELADLIRDACVNVGFFYGEVPFILLM